MSQVTGKSVQVYRGRLPRIEVVRRGGHIVRDQHSYSYLVRGAFNEILGTIA